MKITSFLTGFELRGLLRTLDLFKHLSDSELAAIASSGELISVSAGEELCQPDESCPSLFIVVKGKAQVSTQSPMGDLSVRVVGPKDSFPLAALLEIPGLVTTAKALTDMDLFAIRLTSFFELCARDTDIGMRVYRATAQFFAHECIDMLRQLAASTEEILRAGGFSTSSRRIKCMFCGGRGQDDVDLYPVGKLGSLHPICNLCIGSWTDTLRAAASKLADDAAFDLEGRGD